jgi:hypothetical protein
MYQRYRDMMEMASVVFETHLTLCHWCPGLLFQHYAVRDNDRNNTASAEFHTPLMQL